MKRLFLIFYIGFSTFAFSQYDIDEAKKEDEKSDDKISTFELKKRIYVGGEFGFSFGAGSTYLHLAPLVGYDITERFSAGLSSTYQFWRLRTPYDTYNFSTVGAGIFTRYRPIDWLITQVEFDMYNTVDFYSPSFERINVPAFMAGIGFARSMGEGAYGHVILMYDFINDPNMPLPPMVFAPLHLKLGMVWHLN
jgi:hypothetical protein